MKLKIKHLAPYLPYGLNARMSIPFDEETITEIVGLTEEHAELIGIRKTITEHFEFSDIKPILRPLSEIPIEILDEYNFYRRPTIEDLQNCSYEFYEYCIKNKYDFFGLIEQGLAVSVTNELNPYK